jgi:hypothetical protein
MPSLVAVQESHGSRGLTVVTITSEHRAKVAAFISSKQFELPTWSGLSQGIEWLPEGVVPVAFVIDRRGTVRHFSVGRQSRDQLEAAIEPFL